MSGPLTPEQDAEVRAIAASMIGQALRGAAERIEASIASTVVVLPVHTFTTIALKARDHG